MTFAFNNEIQLSARSMSQTKAICCVLQSSSASFCIWNCVWRRGFAVWDANRMLKCKRQTQSATTIAVLARHFRHSIEFPFNLRCQVKRFRAYGNEFTCIRIKRHAITPSLFAFDCYFWEKRATNASSEAASCRKMWSLGVVRLVK